MWKIENVFLNITEFVSRFTYLILLILLTYGCQSLKKLRSFPSSPVLLRLGLPSEIVKSWSFPCCLFVAPAINSFCQYLFTRRDHNTFELDSVYCRADVSDFTD